LGDDSELVLDDGVHEAGEAARSGDGLGAEVAGVAFPGPEREGLPRQRSPAHYFRRRRRRLLGVVLEEVVKVLPYDNIT
jgi:hypothetical protein